MKELNNKIENLEIERAKKAVELEKLEEQLNSLYNELTTKQIEEEKKIINFLRRTNGYLEFDLEGFMGGHFVIESYKMHKDGDGRWRLGFTCENGNYNVLLSSLINLKVIYA